MYIVGTPMKISQPCSTIADNAASPSNFGSITMVAPVRNPVFIVQV